MIGDYLASGVQAGDVGLDNVNDEIAPVDDLGSDALCIFIEVGVFEQFWVMFLEGQCAGPADENDVVNVEHLEELDVIGSHFLGGLLVAVRENRHAAAMLFLWHDDFDVVALHDVHEGAGNVWIEIVGRATGEEGYFIFDWADWLVVFRHGHAEWLVGEIWHNAAHVKTEWETWGVAAGFSFFLEDGALEVPAKAHTGVHELWMVNDVEDDFLQRMQTFFAHELGTGSENDLVDFDAAWADFYAGFAGEAEMQVVFEPWGAWVNQTFEQGVNEFDLAAGNGAFFVGLQINWANFLAVAAGHTFYDFFTGEVHGFKRCTHSLFPLKKK